MTDSKRTPSGEFHEPDTSRRDRPSVRDTMRRLLPVLGTPVDAILSHTAALLRTEGNEDTSARVLDIQEHGLRLARVVEALSVYCGRIEAPPAVIDLNQLVAEAVELMEYQFRKAGTTVLFSPGQDVQPTQGHGMLLKQAVMAVLGNSLEAVENWPGLREVSVSTTADANELAVWITDTGPGIPAADRGRVFDPFFSTRPGALGLGLSLVDGVARLHGGTASLGDAGGGCALNVRLPVRDRPAAPADKTAPPAQRPRVLVVDDEPLVLDVIGEMLTTLGYAVECVMSTESAIERLKRESYKALFVDFFMPDTNGVAFIRMAEQQGHVLPPMALLTGDATTDSVLALTRERKLPVLEKPFSFDDLKATLRRLFEG